MMTVGAIRTLVFALVGATVPGQDNQWGADLDKALEGAKQRKRPVAIAVHTEHDWTSKELFELHYADAKVRELFGECELLLCYSGVAIPPAETPIDGADSEAYRAIEAKLRKVLRAGTGSRLNSPQHVFLSPEGELVGTATGRVTVGELEWVIARAIRRVDPEHRYQHADRARSPFDWSEGRAPKQYGFTPHDSHKIGDVMKKYKNPYRLKWSRDAEFLAMLRSESSRVASWVRNTMRRIRYRDALIKAIGYRSPPTWWATPADWLDDHDSEVRVAAAAALERMRTPKVFGKLSTQLRKEKDPVVRGRILRAMAASKPTDKTVARMIGRALTTAPKHAERVHATIAVGLLEDRATITNHLHEALGDDTPEVRSAAAFVIAQRRDSNMLEPLRLAMKSERDLSVRRYMEAATRVVRGEVVSTFDGFVEKATGKRASQPPGDSASKAGAKKKRGTRRRSRKDPAKKDAAKVGGDKKGDG